MKKELNKIIYFIKEHKKQIVLLFVIALLTYFVKIFNYSISIDTEVNTNNATANDLPWISTGRWTLLFIGKIVHYKGIFNPFVSNLIMIMFLTSSIVLLSYLLNKIFKDNNNINKIIIILGLVIITSPCIAEMLNFTLMTAEIGIAMFLTILSVYSTYIVVFEHNKLFYILAVLSLMVGMGTYQAFYPLYIGVVTFIYSLELIENGKLKLKENIFSIFKILLIFIVSYGLSSIISTMLLNHYNLTKSGYLTNQIAWGKNPLSDIFHNIKDYVQQILIAKNSVFFTKIYLFISILTIVSAIDVIQKKKSKSILILSSLFVSYASPFMLCILMGAAPVNRTQFCLPFVTALFITLFIHLFDNKRLQYAIMFLTLCFSFSQYKTTSDLFYSDYIRYKEDVRFTQDVMNKIDMMDGLEKNREDMIIVFVGAHSPKSSASALKGETLGYSFYEWDQGTEFGANIRINGFANTIGYRYILPTKEDVKRAREISNKLEVYPKKDSIKVIGDMIVVKLS